VVVVVVIVVDGVSVVIAMLGSAGKTGVAVVELLMSSRPS